MRNAVGTLCLILVLVPLLACGKKRAIAPLPPPVPSAPQAPDSDPDPEPEPEAEPDPVPAQPPAPLPPPEPEDDYLAQADQAYLKQRYEKALELYRRHLKYSFSLMPDHSRFRYGLLIAKNGDYSEAIKQLGQVRQVEPEVQVQVDLLIELLNKALEDAQEKDTLKRTLDEIMKKLNS